MYSKIAYLGKGAHPVNLNRYQLFIDFYNFKETQNIKLLYKHKTIIFYTDNCNLFNHLKILLNSLYSKNSIIIYWNLEIYLLSYKYYLEEILSIPSVTKKIKSSLKFFIFWVPKIFINKIILSRFNTILILSSEERKKIFLNIYNQNSLYVLRNKPVSINFEPYLNLIKLKEISNLISKRFLFLPGSINNFEDFNIIINFSKKYNLDIILATTQINTLENILLKNKNIKNIGSVPNYLIQFLISKCIAGICLYRNNTTNQKLSASSKLFEFLYFNKLVIVSRNIGVLSELKIIQYVNYIITDKLQENISDTSNNIKNENMLFNNELLSLKRSNFLKFEY
jgi:hypothetical protein